MVEAFMSNFAVRHLASDVFFTEELQAESEMLLGCLFSSNTKGGKSTDLL